MSALVDDLIQEAKLPVLVPGPKVAEFFGVSDRTIRRWISCGRIRKTFRTSPGGSAQVLVPRTEVARLLEEMQA